MNPSSRTWPHDIPAVIVRQLTPFELHALRRFLRAFPGSVVGKFRPHERVAPA